MKLPSELTLAVKIRRQRRACRENARVKPITGRYCPEQRPRMARELREIAEAL